MLNARHNHERGTVLKLLFYGRLADVIGRALEFDAPSGCSISEVRRTVIARCPDASSALMDKRVRAYVDGSAVGDEDIVGDSATIEFLAPVSGG